MADQNSKITDRQRREDERAQAKKLPLAADLFLVDDKGESHVEPAGRSIFDTK